MNDANPFASASGRTFAIAFVPAARSCSYGAARTASMPPSSAATASPIFEDHCLSIVVSMEPLWIIALWKSPAADGVARRVDTFPPPPDWPNMVTFEASPPNAAALSRTHSRAATRSRRPALPEAAYFSPNEDRSRNPRTLSLWLTVTTTTSPFRARLAPSYDGSSWPEPVAYPPPWSHTMTGRFLPSFMPGVHTFALRQSSPGKPSFQANENPSSSLAHPFLTSCGAVGP